MFSDETPFHTSINVHRHNVRIWENEVPHAFNELELQPFWYDLARGRITEALFFVGNTAGGIVYVDMLELRALPQIEDENLTFQHVGTTAWLCQRC